MIAGNEEGGSRAVKRSPCFSMAQLVKIDLVDVGERDPLVDPGRNNFNTLNQQCF